MSAILKNKAFLLLVVSLIICSACTKDTDSNCDNIPVYNGDVKNIIDTYCATAGCHDGNNGAPGNFRSYQGLSTITSNGKFTRRVIELKDMPPGGNLPSSDFEKLRCWAENGFPLQ